MRVVGGYELREKLIGRYSIRLYDKNKKKFVRISPLVFENKWRVEKKDVRSTHGSKFHGKSIRF